MIRIIHSRILGGWFIVRGPHQTPISGRFDSRGLICPTSCPLLTLICLWYGRLTPSWRMPTRRQHRMLGVTFARVWNVACRMSGTPAGVSSTGIAVAAARMPRAADAVTHRGRTMSRSNSMHHAPKRPVWPFPVTLPAPGHAPDPRPARAPVPYPVNAPAAPF
jgi:hypothetical protein